MIVAELFTLFGVEMDSSWKKVDSMLSGLAHKALIFGTAAAYGLGRLVEHSTETATHIVSLSRAMGLSIKQTQEWGYVAQQSGSNLKELSVGISMFIGNLRKMELSKNGGGALLKDGLAKLGISAKDAAAALKSPEGLDVMLLRISNRLKALGNSPEVAGIVRQLFGARAGRAIAADLARGGDAIIEMRKHFRTLGAEMSEEQVLGLRSLGNKINDVKLAFNGLVNQALAEAAPIIEGLADKFIKFITDVDNRKEIIETFKKVIKAIGDIAPDVGRAVLLLGRAIGWLADHKDMVEDLVVAVIALKAAVFAISVGKGLLSLITAFTNLGKAAAVATTNVAAAGAAKGFQKASYLYPAGAAASGAGAAINNSKTIELGAAGVAAKGAGAVAGEFGAGVVAKELLSTVSPLLAIAAVGSLLDDVLPNHMEEIIQKFKKEQEAKDNRPTLEEQAAISQTNTITNETTIIVHAGGANDKVADEIEAKLAEHEANRNRDTIDKLGARGRRQK